MATLRAYQTFDIREVIRSGGRLVEAEDRIVIRHGDCAPASPGISTPSRPGPWGILPGSP